MKKRKLCQRRLLALALSAAIIFTSTDVSTLAAEAVCDNSDEASGTEGVTGIVNDHETEGSSDTAEGSEAGNGVVSIEGSGTGDGTASTEGSEAGDGTEPTEGLELGDGTEPTGGSGTEDGAESTGGSEVGNGTESNEGSEAGDGTESTEEGLKAENGVGSNGDSEIDDGSDESIRTPASDPSDAKDDENEANDDVDSEVLLLPENVTEDDADEAGYEVEDSQRILSEKSIGTGLTWYIDKNNRFEIYGYGEYLSAEYLEYPPWAYRAESVEDIYEIDVYNIQYTKNMFYGFKKLTSITAQDFKKFDTSDTLEMEGMFSGCSALRSLYLGNFNTSKVTNMKNMFSGCSALTSLNVSSFDTGEVTSMKNMFSGCSSLKSLDLSVFETGKVTSMENMFSSCSSLTSLDISGFDTSKVTSMENMFSGCSALLSLDLSGFDMGNVVNVDNFINDCSEASYICTPRNCAMEIELPEGSWYGEDGTEYARIPANLSDSIILYKGGYPGDGSGLTKQLLFISGITVVSKEYDGKPIAIGTAVMVDSEGNEIPGISLSASYSGLMANGSNYAKSEEMPLKAGIYKLSYDVTGLDADRYILPKTSFDFRIDRRTVTVTAPSISVETEEMLTPEMLTCEISGLLENDIMTTMPGLRSSIRTNPNDGSIIPGCYDLEPYGAEVDASVSDNYKIVYINGKLAVGVDLPEDNKDLIASGKMGAISWKLDKAGKLTLEGKGDYTNAAYEDAYGPIFVRPDWIEGYIGNKVISAEVNITNITHTQFMFFGCKNLKSVDLSGLDTSNVVNMSYMFAGCSSLESLDVSGFDTSNVQFMNAMFALCSSLKSLDVSNFNTAKVKVMGDFYHSSPILDWNPGLVNPLLYNYKGINGMFQGCSSLENLDLSSFDTSKVKRMNGMFLGCSALRTLDLGDIDTSLNYYMSYMFAGCSSLKSLDLSVFDTSNTYYMDDMFSGCSSLTSLDITGFDTSKVERMQNMFAGCSSLTSLDLSNFNTSGLNYDSSMSNMFSNCSSLSLILTPKNCACSPELPGEAEDIWTSENGTKYSELPSGLANSIALYKNAYNEETGTLTKKLVYISGISVVDKTYDGSANPYVGTAVVKDSEGNIVSDITLSYTYAGTLTNGTPYTGIAEEPPSQAGTYALHIEASGADADKYIFYKNAYTFCISQKEIRITAPYIEIELNGKVPELSSLTYEVNGSAEDGELPEGEAMFTNLMFRYAPGGLNINTSKPGKYLIIPYDAVLNTALANNYRIKYEYGTLIVGDADDNSPYDYTDRIDLSGQELKAVISNIKAKTYNGYAHEPTVKVTVMVNGKKKALTEGMDYALAYKNNINAGTGTVIVKGRGEYRGELTKEFTINPKSVKKLKYIIGSMSVGDDSANPHIYVYDGPNLLQKGRDYTLSGTENLNGQPSKGVTITVNGTADSALASSESGNESVTANYKGSKKIKIAVYDAEASKIIKPADIYWGADNTSQTSLLSADYSQPYTGKAIKPDVTIVTGGKVLTKNKDYKIQYQNNKNAGTAYVVITGKREYKGKVAATFEITPLNLSDEAQNLEIKPIADKTYNGKLQKPSVKVKAGRKTLKKNRDYTLSYVNNVHASTGNSKAEVIVTGKGNYSGMAKQTFTIKKQAIKKVSVKGTYEKGLAITYGNRKLTEGIHYTLQYGVTDKKKITVKITAKTGSDFTGSVTKKIKIK
ncbi:MAG: BspA family leucine-rich repeat surface protein [Lachnospiraceae bacterium]|nr:BspA family leucine-rich repeat surface protein [Lachnospiraceae bacterium]